MDQDTEPTPVLFRVARDGAGDYLTAVFPTEPGTLDYWTMGAYAHVGQHCSCSLDWYRTTRPATPTEYADLLAELESIGYRPRSADASRRRCTTRGGRRSGIRATDG